MTDCATISPPLRILVIKLSSLGDLFHALPVVHRLQAELGGRVDWVTQPEYVELVSCFDGVDRVIPFPRRTFWRALPTLWHDLRMTPYTYVFDFQGLLKSAITARMTRAERRIGPSWQREGARWFYHHVAGTRDKQRHAVEEAMDFVRDFGWAQEPPKWSLHLPAHRAVSTGRPRIGYLPCSRWNTKNWPEEQFCEVIDTVHQRKGGTALILGGKEDHATGERMAQRCSAPVENNCGRTSLVALASLIQTLDLLVTVDSGPMHMAAALGVPVCAIFGATDPLRTGPYGTRHRVVQLGGLPCQPCRSRRCLRPERDLACLRQLNSGRVVETVCTLLEEKTNATGKNEEVRLQ